MRKSFSHAGLLADKDDDERVKSYILQRVPPMLKKELERYLPIGPRPLLPVDRAEPSRALAPRRTIPLSSAFWVDGAYQPSHRRRLITFMIREDLGEVAQEYATWLRDTQRRKFSTIANYINGLVSITSYCYANWRRVIRCSPQIPTH